MTADQLIAFNGALAREAAARAEAGDARDMTAIVDDILREIRAPDLGDAVSAVSAMLNWRRGPASRVLP